MKVLLDENLDHRLRNHIGLHDVFTANFQLLKAAEAAGFEVLVTGDRTLSYEQNLTRRRLAVVALSCVEWAVNCGAFSRKNIPASSSARTRALNNIER